VPELVALLPDSVAAGADEFALTVKGTNFTRRSVVRWNGEVRETSYVSATELTATITGLDVLFPGRNAVTVFNPAAGSGSSNALPFVVQRSRRSAGPLD
jgi:hypothetical protein